MQLLLALRAVSRIESSAIREGVFRDIASRSPAIRLALRAHALCRRLGLGPLLVGAYGFSYFVRLVLPGQRVRWLAVGLYANEVKELDALAVLLGPDAPARVGWRLFNVQGLGAVRLRKLRSLYRMVVHIERRHGFMPACRVMATLFMYLRFHAWLKAMQPNAVVVTSDYSPDGAALTAAAGSLGIRRVYVPHALPSLQIGRSMLAYDAYVFDSEAMRERFSRLAPIAGEVVYRGVRGGHTLMKRMPPGRVGVFLAGATHMEGLLAMVRALSGRFAEVLVRGHPVDFTNPDFTQVEQAAANVRISRGQALEQDAASCTLVVAGNTTAILEVLRQGVPVVYSAQLDTIPRDYNGFVTDGLVPELVSPEALQPQAVQNFFDAAWEKRMRYFDAGYGQDAQALRTQLVAALKRWGGVA